MINVEQSTRESRHVHTGEHTRARGVPSLYPTYTHTHKHTYSTLRQARGIRDMKREKRIGEE